jgi:hypothetical protein
MTWLYLLLFAVWLFGFSYLMLGRRKAPARLRDWADRHRLKIIDRNQPVLTWKGPFAERTSSQVLYRVVLEDHEGERHVAWVLCGGPIRGSWVDRVEVRWAKGEESTSQAMRRFESQTDRRRSVETMRRLGFRSLLWGPGLGLCIALVMLHFAGLIQSSAAVPMLVISVVLGAIVGGSLGMVGGAFRAWITQDLKRKRNRDAMS